MLRALACALLPTAAALPAQAATPSPLPMEAPADPPAPSEGLALGSSGVRMTVPVEIAGAGPFRFIIDTGAQRTVISRELAGELGLARGRDVRLIAMTGASNVGTVLIPSISVSTLGGKGIEAPALEQRHLGAPGMLGIDSLQGHSVRIDFDHGTMAVTPATQRHSRYAPAGPDEIVVRARSLFGQLVVTDATIAGTRVRVVLDTGSEVTLGNEALRRRLNRRREGAPISLVSVTGGTLVAPYSSVNRFRLGSMTINNLPIAFSDAAPFAQFGLADKPAVLLGMDALRLFRRVNIDFANREVRMLLPKDTPYAMPS